MTVDIMTGVTLPGAGHWGGIAEEGKMATEEIIQKYREIAQKEIDWAQKVLDAPAEHFRVVEHHGLNQVIIQEGLNCERS